ncbi:MAG: hypothetical protein J0I84_16520 [Terrimonas sp.]|nr:hypothetical protein [Terrimonas sp.]
MRKMLPLLVCAALIIGISSCRTTGGVAKKITVKSGQLPPEIATEDFILVGQLAGRKSYDKYLRKNFEKYTGKYVLATEKELNTTYADTEKYRFVMDYNRESRSIMVNGQFSEATSYRYYILDRKENKKYTRKSGSGQFSKEIEAYLKAIELTRKK